jgi:hypothetical protein
MMRRAKEAMLAAKQRIIVILKKNPQPLLKRLIV